MLANIGSILALVPLKAELSHNYNILTAYLQVNTFSWGHNVAVSGSCGRVRLPGSGRQLHAELDGSARSPRAHLQFTRQPVHNIENELPVVIVRSVHTVPHPPAHLSSHHGGFTENNDTPLSPFKGETLSLASGLRH